MGRARRVTMKSSKINVAMAEELSKSESYGLSKNMTVCHGTSLLHLIIRSSAP